MKYCGFNFSLRENKRIISFIYSVFNSAPLLWHPVYTKVRTLSGSWWLALPSRLLQAVDVQGLHGFDVVAPCASQEVTNIFWRVNSLGPGHAHCSPHSCPVSPVLGRRVQREEHIVSRLGGESSVPPSNPKTRDTERDQGWQALWEPRRLQLEHYPGAPHLFPG